MLRDLTGTFERLVKKSSEWRRYFPQENNRFACLSGASWRNDSRREEIDFIQSFNGPLAPFLGRQKGNVPE